LYDLFCYLLACCTRVDTNIYGRFYYTYGAFLSKVLISSAGVLKLRLGFWGVIQLHTLSFVLCVG
jgi:hypothetical protein